MLFVHFSTQANNRMLNDTLTQFSKLEMNSGLELKLLKFSHIIIVSSWILSAVQVLPIM